MVQVVKLVVSLCWKFPKLAKLSINFIQSSIVDHPADQYQTKTSKMHFALSYCSRKTQLVIRTTVLSHLLKTCFCRLLTTSTSSSISPRTIIASTRGLLYFSHSTWNEVLSNIPHKPEVPFYGFCHNKGAPQNVFIFNL